MSPTSNRRDDVFMPGRNLDALIAEKVMGWGVERVMESPPRFTGWGIPNGGERPPRKIPHYSTDIAAAWEVVEHFEKNGKHNLDFHKGKMWFVSFMSERGGEGVNPPMAKTFPHAICLAALRAVGYDIHTFNT